MTRPQIDNLLCQGKPPKAGVGPRRIFADAGEAGAYIAEYRARQVASEAADAV
jgi:hypothetical protein